MRRIDEQLKAQIIEDAVDLKREALAIKYGLSISTVNRIVSGKVPRRRIPGTSSLYSEDVLKVARATRRAYRYVNTHLGHIDAVEASELPMTAKMLSTCGIELGKLFELASMLASREKPSYLVMSSSPLLITPGEGVKKLTWREVYVAQTYPSIPYETALSLSAYIQGDE